VLAVVTDPLEDAEPIDEIRRRGNDSELEVRVIVPAVERSAFRHAMGDVDEPIRQAECTLEASLSALRDRGVEASGEVGDADPVLAAADALREAPADEVLIFEHAEDQARWFEVDLFDRARAMLEPPLRVVLVDHSQGSAHVVDIEKAGLGTSLAGEPEVEIPISHNMPQVSRGDLAGMVMGVLGTIVVIVLAAAGPGPDSGWGAASILIAMGIAIVNMAHVVGLTIFDSVRYRGGWERFFRGVALVGTPAAVLVNLLILLLA
jgi:hypothetical protein